MLTGLALRLPVSRQRAALIDRCPRQLDGRATPGQLCSVSPSSSRPSRPSPAGSKSVRGPCCSGRERPSLCGQRAHVLVSQDLFRAAVACGPSTSTRSKPKPGSGRRRLSPCLTRGPLDAEQTTAHQRQEARCLQLKCVHALDMDGNASIFDADADAKAIQLIKRWDKRVECFLYRVQYRLCGRHSHHGAILERRTPLHR